MVDFAIHIFCGILCNVAYYLKAFWTKRETIIKYSLTVCTDQLLNLGNRYDFPFNSKTVSLKMLIEVFLD